MRRHKIKRRPHTEAPPRLEIRVCLLIDADLHSAIFLLAHAVGRGHPRVGFALTAGRDAGDDPLRESLASNLLQSRAQLRIFRHDDEVDLSCQSRAFVGAEVVSQPRMIDKDLDERKWLERWVLDRCGAEVSYHVFFTEVGEGGAYFSFQEIESNVAPSNGQSVK